MNFEIAAQMGFRFLFYVSVRAFMLGKQATPFFAASLLGIALIDMHPYYGWIKENKERVSQFKVVIFTGFIVSFSLMILCIMLYKQGGDEKYKEESLLFLDDLLRLGGELAMLALNSLLLL